MSSFVLSPCFSTCRRHSSLNWWLPLQPKHCFPHYLDVANNKNEKWKWNIFRGGEGAHLTNMYPCLPTFTSHKSFPRQIQLQEQALSLPKHKFMCHCAQWKPWPHGGLEISLHTFDSSSFRTCELILSIPSLKLEHKLLNNEFQKVGCLVYTIL